MSSRFPVIALTGASGAGKTNVKEIFKKIFLKSEIRTHFVEGDSFHKYSRREMDLRRKKKENITHFCPEANLLKELENLFQTFSQTGRGKTRQYIHTLKDSLEYNTEVGNFTTWEELSDEFDLLFYEGLHGGYADNNINIARHVDLLIGIAPVINLEWMQKIKRDELIRGYSKKSAIEMIMHRLPHYAKYICPQFSRTDANLQRVPLVDTSDPFSEKSVPDDSKSLFIFEIKNQDKIHVDLKTIPKKIPGSLLSSPNSLAIPGTSLDKLLTTVFSPTINRLAS